MLVPQIREISRFGSKQDIYCDFTTGVGAGEIMAHHQTARARTVS